MDDVTPEEELLGTVRGDDADTGVGDIKAAAEDQALLDSVSALTPTPLQGALLCPNFALGESRGLVQRQGADRTQAS